MSAAAGHGFCDSGDESGGIEGGNFGCVCGTLMDRCMGLGTHAVLFLGMGFEIGKGQG